MSLNRDDDGDDDDGDDNDAQSRCRLDSARLKNGSKTRERSNLDKCNRRKTDYLLSGERWKHLPFPGVCIGRIGFSLRPRFRSIVHVFHGYPHRMYGSHIPMTQLIVTNITNMIDGTFFTR